MTLVATRPALVGSSSLKSAGGTCVTYSRSLSLNANATLSSVVAGVALKTPRTVSSSCSGRITGRSWDASSRARRACSEALSSVGAAG
jgi:hypothetical protein